MPTLFRLVFVLGVVAAASYGVLFAIANVVKPQARTIVEAIALPQSAVEVRTGRSVADVLDHQASALVRHKKRASH